MKIFKGIVALSLLGLVGSTGCGPVDDSELASEANLVSVKQAICSCDPPTTAAINAYCDPAATLYQLSPSCGAAQFGWYCARPVQGCALWSCATQSFRTTSSGGCASVVQSHCDYMTCSD